LKIEKGSNKCPVCGMMVGDQWSTQYEGKTYYFMNNTHREMFLKDPSKFLNR
jgi:YHS domain-containing protein